MAKRKLHPAVQIMELFDSMTVEEQRVTFALVQRRLEQGGTLPTRKKAAAKGRKPGEPVALTRP